MSEKGRQLPCAPVERSPLSSDTPARVSGALITQKEGEGKDWSIINVGVRCSAKCNKKKKHKL